MNETMENNEVVKPYTFRKLSAEDVFPMANIIKKIGIREFKTFFEGDGINNLMAGFNGGKGEKSIEALGVSIAIELVDIIFGNLPKCKDDIFNLLADTSDLSVEKLKALDLADFAQMVIDFIRKEEFKDFMKVVSKLFK